MAALLVAMSVMGIMLSMALPVWRTAVRREREAELIFRGEQYAHAIELFSRRNGGFPPSLDVLEKGRFLRKLYKDPMTGEGEFQAVYLGQVLPGQTRVPAQPGRGGGPATGPAGRTGQAPTAGGRGAPAATQFPGARAGQPPGAASDQAGTIGAGPIIGVVSKSTEESLRLYAGRGRYSEWAFVATAATRQAGSAAGGQNPGQGRGAGQPVPGGRGGAGRSGPLGPSGPLPGRGRAGPGSAPPGRGSPFGPPGGYPPFGGQQPTSPSRP